MSGSLKDKARSKLQRLKSVDQRGRKKATMIHGGTIGRATPRAETFLETGPFPRLYRQQAPAQAGRVLEEESIWMQHTFQHVPAACMFTTTWATRTLPCLICIFLGWDTHTQVRQAESTLVSLFLEWLRLASWLSGFTNGKTPFLHVSRFFSCSSRFFSEGPTSGWVAPMERLGAILSTTWTSSRLFPQNCVFLFEVTVHGDFFLSF